MQYTYVHTHIPEEYNNDDKSIVTFELTGAGKAFTKHFSEISIAK